MVSTSRSIAFGPIPSRRLGRSLGINNIPPKSCTYSCVYCQVGRTQDTSNKRKRFYRVDDIYRESEEKISKSRERKEAIDYLTFVPDGEPTLDINLEREIQRLKTFGIKVAVITNASLMRERSVRNDLSRADLVSVKIDAASEGLWREINRPHRAIRFDEIFRGILEFSELFKGTLITETMLIKGINDKEEDIKKIAETICGLKTSKSYVSVPTRPPAEKHIEPAGEDVISMAYNVFSKKGIDTELLIGYEGDSFSFTGDVKKDLLSIMSVHPMRKKAIEKFLIKANADRHLVERMVEKGELCKVLYRGEAFYLRKYKY